MRFHVLVAAGVGLWVAGAIGCGVAGEGVSPSAPAAGGAGGTTGAGGVRQPTGAAGAGGAAGGGCVGPTTGDKDGDGWTVAEGDCNDCDPWVNPGAADRAQTPGVPPTDLDCDGVPGDGPGPCDEGLAMDDPSPWNAAKAIELCTLATGAKKSGLLDARWTRIDGAPIPLGPPDVVKAFHLGHGLLDNLGPALAPRAGKRLLALSSGAARRPGQVGFVATLDKGISGPNAEGFPVPGYDCEPQAPADAHDDIALEVTLRVPTNALGAHFDFAFLSKGWPLDVCTARNDYAVALASPRPKSSFHGNVLYDEIGDPFSLSLVQFPICACAGCASQCTVGPALLAGTGFEGHASTGWYEAGWGVEPGSTMTLRLGVADVADGLDDSTLLIDAFHWQLAGGYCTDSSQCGGLSCVPPALDCHHYTPKCAGASCGCKTDHDCPTDFACSPGHECLRKACTSNGECSAYCIGRQCFDAPGRCERDFGCY